MKESRETAPSPARRHMSSGDVRLSIRASGGERKEPVLQVFVQLCGLPWRRSLRVVCTTEDSREQLGATAASARVDPLFADPLELWNEASGKEASMPLGFIVEAVSQLDGLEEYEALARARIASDELRRFGLYNPREGAAVALPLYALSTGDEVGKLHCYVHVGYSVRRHVAGRGGSSAAGVTGSRGSGGASTEDAAHVAASAPRQPVLRVQYAQSVAHDPLAIMVRIRGRNMSQRRAIQLGGATLGVPGPWRVCGSSECTRLNGVVLPPRGCFEAHFTLAYGASGSSERSGSIKPRDDGAHGGNGACGDSSEAGTAYAYGNRGTVTTGGEALGGDEIRTHVDGDTAPHAATLEVRYVMRSSLAGDGPDGGRPSEASQSVGTLRTVDAVAVPPARGSAGATRWDRITRCVLLTPPRVSQPFVICSHVINPSSPCVGEVVTLNATLAWPALALCEAPLDGSADASCPRTATQDGGSRGSDVVDAVDASTAGASCDSAAAERAEVPSDRLVEVEVATDGHWILIGMLKQRLRLPAASARVGAASVRLQWKLVALAAGHVPLPSVRLRRLEYAHGQLATSASSAASWQQLPTPPYLEGSYALVRPRAGLGGAVD